MTASGGEVEIAVDLVTEIGHPAVGVAVATRQRIREALDAAGIRVARIDVSVLTIGDDS